MFVETRLGTDFAVLARDSAEDPRVAMFVARSTWTSDRSERVNAVHRARFRGPTDAALDDETLWSQVEFSARAKAERFAAAGFRAFRGRALATVMKDDAARAGRRVSLRGGWPSPILTVA